METTTAYVRFEVMEMRSRIVVGKLPVNFLLEDPLASRAVVNLERNGRTAIVSSNTVSEFQFILKICSKLLLKKK